MYDEMYPKILGFRKRQRSIAWQSWGSWATGVTWSTPVCIASEFTENLHSSERIWKDSSALVYSMQQQKNVKLKCTGLLKNESVSFLMYEYQKNTNAHKCLPDLRMKIVCPSFTFLKHWFPSADRNFVLWKGTFLVVYTVLNELLRFIFFIWRIGFYCV